MPPRRPKAPRHNIFTRHGEVDFPVMGKKVPRSLRRKRLRLSVRLDQDLGNFLYRYAEENRLSVTQVVEDALGHFRAMVSKARAKAGKKHAG